MIKTLHLFDRSIPGLLIFFVKAGIAMLFNPLCADPPSNNFETGIEAPAEGDESYQLEHSEDLANRQRHYRAQELAKPWTLVWGDEFDGPKIDRSKWKNEVSGNGGGNEELQYYTDESENSWVEGGMLIIEARKESYESRGESKDYTSARLNTKFRGDWKYGRIEARARLPIGQGLLPAIWMLSAENQYGAWAASGEIDIVEVLGHEPSTVHGTIHYGGQWPRNTSTGAEYELESGTVEDAFHTYAIEWKEGEISWSVDGQTYQTLTNWSSAGESFPAPFDQSFYLIVNLAVGGNWPGDPNGTTAFPARMEVDYLRVYQWVE